MLTPDELNKVGSHVAAGAGFVANLAFWSEIGYFDHSAATKPLLHLWSLGIEAQFYVLYARSCCTIHGKVDLGRFCQW